MNRRKIILLIIVILIIVFVALYAFTGSNVIDDVKPKGDVSIAVVGDITFAKSMSSVLSGGKSPYAGVENVTSKVDLLLINFENPSTNSSNAVKGDIPFKSSPEYAKLAKNNNNTVAAIANNHVFDYGIDGMHDTVNNLKNEGMAVLGAGDNASQANAPVTQEINGRKITIFNYMDSDNFAEYSNDAIPRANETSPGFSVYNSDIATKQIKEAKKNGSDFVLVYFHYGNEYSNSPNENQVKMSHEVIDAGADIVLGSHPHVPQGIEMYNGTPIFYSLGNFMFYDLAVSKTRQDYFVEIDLVNDTAECTVYPVNIVGFLPQFMTPSEGTSLLKSLSPQCDQLQITDAGTGKLSYKLK